MHINTYIYTQFPPDVNIFIYLVEKQKHAKFFSIAQIDSYLKWMKSTA